MRSLTRLFPAVVIGLFLFAAPGCEQSATPPSPAQEATRVSNEKAAMEKFHATNKSGKPTAAKPGEQPKDVAPTEAPKP
ncbi:hypothetical protein [Paludisphaera mucosa]|uniref:Lipoprotein n=1 Tax=Paludisphaera mucosa TaxID=3030827 RepID=A0ABT6F8F8_9BACT|nr:hypothetical protein [Paludisphaera mucosa]MDG3003871.1 hypothetical protein [Paludisphaera mucosa]